MVKVEVRTAKLIRLGLCTLMGLGMTACASTNIVKMTEPAPITYKIGQGATQYASLTLPKVANKNHRRQSSPKYSMREPMPYSALPQKPSYSGPQFSEQSTDSELYAHQKLGKRYKVNGESYSPKHEPNYDETGIASWYGEKFHGRPTATGETFNMNDLTAAHKTLPLNSMLHVENLENGRSLIVRLNDRGPFIDNRIIDLSKGAAEALGTINGGLARVRVRYIGPADPNAATGPIMTPPVYEDIPPALSVEAPTPTPKAVPYSALPYSGVDTMPFEAPKDTSPATPKVSLDYFDVQRGSDLEPNYNPIAPTRPVPTPIAEPEMPEDGGQITLTIKGPIHIAKHDKTSAEPKFIPAVNYREYKTKR